jgi:hypothetical protein
MGGELDRGSAAPCRPTPGRVEVLAACRRGGVFALVALAACGASRAVSHKPMSTSAALAPSTASADPGAAAVRAYLAMWNSFIIASQTADYQSPSLSRLRLPHPVIRSSLAPGELQLVDLPTWLWMAPGVWTPVSKTASVPESR